MPHVCTSDCVKGVFSFLMETHNLFCYSRACLLSFHSSTKEQKCWVIGDTYRDTIPHLYQENNRNE
jgi:hypothetical protein